MTWLEETVAEMVKLGGTLVDDNEFERRMSICSNCPFKGKVNPLPFTEFDGCTKCGCPFETKGKMSTHFSFKHLKVIKTECPINKW